MFWKKLFASAAPSKSAYGLPEGELVYAVGDIHGRIDLLLKLRDLIETDMASRPHENATIVFLGDYVDRGFHSCEVIDALITMKIAGAKVICLAGNHEDMMLQFLADPSEGQMWLGVGGLATLASYGVYLEEETDFDALLDASNALGSVLPRAHLDFLKGLDEHWQLGEILFVHAGLRPGIPLSAQRRRDKLGIRREFMESNYDFGVKIVHGHTGVRKPISNQLQVAVDTGAFATGVLTAAVLQDASVSFVST